MPRSVKVSAVLTFDPWLAFDGVLEKLLTLSPVHVVLRWLNPRKHPWRIPVGAQ